MGIVGRCGWLGCRESVVQVAAGSPTGAWLWKEVRCAGIEEGGGARTREESSTQETETSSCKVCAGE